MELRKWAEREVKLDKGSEAEIALEILDILLKHNVNELRCESILKKANNLFNRKCIYMIKESNAEWRLLEENEKYIIFSSDRMPNLHKYVNKETKEVEKYIDANRIKFYNSDVEIDKYRAKFIRNFVEENYLKDITLPYIESYKPYIVNASYFNSKGNSLGWDTIDISNIKTPRGDIMHINRYFKKDISGELKEISEKEFNKIKEKYDIMYFKF